MECPSEEEQDAAIAQPLDSDHVNITLAGGAAILNGADDFDPSELLHGGEHFDDVSRAIHVSRKKNNELLPREIMCNIVEL
jgi:hypothetical protein